MAARKASGTSPSSSSGPQSTWTTTTRAASSTGSNVAGDRLNGRHQDFRSRRQFGLQGDLRPGEPPSDEGHSPAYSLIRRAATFGPKRQPRTSVGEESHRRRPSNP